MTDFQLRNTIRQAMAHRGLTQTGLARKSFIDSAHMSRMMKYDTGVWNLEMLERVARGLGMLLKVEFMDTNGAREGLWTTIHVSANGQAPAPLPQYIAPPAIPAATSRRPARHALVTSLADVHNPLKAPNVERD